MMRIRNTFSLILVILILFLPLSTCTNPIILLGVVVDYSDNSWKSFGYFINHNEKSNNNVKYNWIQPIIVAIIFGLMQKILISRYLALKYLRHKKKFSSLAYFKLTFINILNQYCNVHIDGCVRMHFLYSICFFSG